MGRLGFQLWPKKISEPFKVNIKTYFRTPGLLILNFWPTLPGHGGGIALLYKENLLIDKLELVKNEFEEILWIKIKGKNPLLLGTVYITDYCDMLKDKSGESKLEKHLIEAVSKNCEICLLGDFN